MTEHVCEITQDYPGIPYEHEDFSGTMERREEVVRCRDCVHWRKPNKHERSKCTGVMAFVEPTPDGFCAWAKRREESCK